MNLRERDLEIVELGTRRSKEAVNKLVSDVVTIVADHFGLPEEDVVKAIEDGLNHE